MQLSRRLALALLLTVVPGCGSGDAPAASSASSGAETPATATGDVAHPFVWRVDGASGPSYLLGTIHVAVRLEQAIPPELASALAAARVVVVEADVAPDAVTPELVARYGIVTSGPTLDQRLTPAQWTQLTNELVPLGIPAEALARMRAWIPATTLLMARMEHMPGAAPAVGADGRPIAMDMEILNATRSRGGELRFLETAEDQFALLSGVGDDYMIDWLTELLESPAGPGSDVEELVTAYRAGDFATIQRLTLEDDDMRANPALFDAMFARRNRAWLPALREELARGGAFVAVGAGHFVGPNGILRLLEAEGIEAVRIPPR
jgi:uncharacterized protein YbaP (TraB family)